MITVYRTNWNDLTITFEGIEDKLIIQGYFTFEDNRNFNVNFADGTRYAYDSEENPLKQVHATEYDDWMSAWSDNGIVIHGDGGNDTLNGGAGDDVEISQAYPLKIGGLVELDERRQRLIQHPGKFLPAGVGQRGQGDEVLGEIQLPSAVLREEVVVGDGRLRLWLTVDDLGRQNVLLPGVLGKILPDMLLKIGRLHIVDGENGGKAQLADDLVGQRFFIVGAGTVGKQHKNSSFA